MFGEGISLNFGTLHPLIFYVIVGVEHSVINMFFL